jgi:hypothetical protein
MLVACPHCKAKVPVPESPAGGAIPCPSCRQPFRVPATRAPGTDTKGRGQTPATGIAPAASPPSHKLPEWLDDVGAAGAAPVPSPPPKRPAEPPPLPPVSAEPPPLPSKGAIKKVPSSAGPISVGGAREVLRGARRPPKDGTNVVAISVVAVGLLVLALGGVAFWFQGRSENEPKQTDKGGEMVKPLATPISVPAQRGPKEVNVRFAQLDHQMPGGSTSKLRVEIGRPLEGQHNEDITLKFEAPSNIKVPAAVKVEKGQLEVEVMIAAGEQPGKYVLRVVPEGLKNTAVSDECRVTVLEPRKPSGPREVAVRFLDADLSLEAGKSGKLRLAVSWKGDEEAGDITLKFEAPDSLKLSRVITVNKKSPAEVVVPITAGETVGRYAVKVVPVGLSNKSPEADTCTVTVRAATGPAEKVTADYFPFEEGRMRTCDQAVMQARGKVVVSRIELVDKADGAVEVRVVKTGTLVGPDLQQGTVRWSSAAPSTAVQTIRHRVREGFVEVGVPGKEKDTLVWDPQLKIDAKEGDAWNWTLPSGQTKRYDIVKFTRHKGRAAVVVRSVLETPQGETITLSTYVRNVGEVERTVAVKTPAGTAVVGQTLLLEKQ